MSHVLTKTGVDGDETMVAPPKYQCTFGVFHIQEMFVHKALQLAHPFDSLCPVKDSFLCMFFQMITMGSVWVVQQRSATLKKWLGWGKELGAEEKSLHLSLEPGVEQGGLHYLLAGKTKLFST